MHTMNYQNVARSQNVSKTKVTDKNMMNSIKISEFAEKNRTPSSVVGQFPPPSQNSIIACLKNSAVIHFIFIFGLLEAGLSCFERNMTDIEITYSKLPLKANVSQLFAVVLCFATR